MTVSTFLISCERAAAGGAESRSPESPGGSQYHAGVQIFHLCEQCAVVAPKSWWPTRDPVLHSFRDKAEWKTKSHNRRSKSPELINYFLFPDHGLSHLFLCCGATVLLTHLQPVHKPSAGLTQLFLQPQSHHEINTQHLHSLAFLTHLSRNLSTTTLGLTGLGLWLVFLSQSTPLSRL